MNSLIDIQGEFEAMVRHLFDAVAVGLDKWKMDEEDWESCDPMPSADYQRGYNEGVESVKSLLPMLLDEDFWMT